MGMVGEGSGVWNFVPLECVVLPTGRRDPTQSPDERFAYVEIGSVDNDRGAITSARRLLGKEAPSRARKVIHSDDVIFATTRPYLRNIALVPDQYDKEICSTGFCVLRPNRDLVEPRWLYYLCRSDIVLDQVLPKMRGASYPAVTDGDILVSEIPLPPLGEQRRIVARIEALFEHMAEARHLRAAAEEDVDRLVPAAMQEVFANTRDGYEVSGIPEDEVKSIGDICTLHRGRFSHRPRNDPRFFGGATPWIQINNIPKDYSKHITTKMDTLNEAGLSISKLFPKGTIVISIAATIGAVGVLAFDACFPDSLVGITPSDDQADSGFLYWQLCFVQSHLEAVAPYAAQKNINLAILGKLKLWIPPLPQQVEINARLDGVQAQVAELKRLQTASAAEVERLEGAVLARAFRGES